MHEPAAVRPTPKTVFVSCVGAHETHEPSDRKQKMKLVTIYKCSIAISVALMCGLAGAYAGTNDTYYDLVRPNGHARDDATFEADLNFCYGQSGVSRYRQDTPAFKQCMLGRKWRWQSVRITRNPSGSGSGSGWGQEPQWQYDIKP